MRGLRRRLHLGTDAVERFVQAKQDEDVEAAVACFADGAVVRDDGHEHVGLDAIRAWLTDVSSTFELAGADPNGDSAVACVDVAGNFPGSPITFRF
jgi:ketosteroid isomerase-like protein